MDLLICPSCQQSVLDDEATLCPFCGAAMDGSSGPTQPVKPVAKSKPASQSAQSKPQAEKPAAETKKARAEEKAAPKEDDPFAVKPQAGRKAIALQRKPTAKISHRVVCPMCDTNGFGTEDVAGKEVKCPNPKCLMPIFVAPEIVKEVPPPPKKPLLTPVTIGVAAFVLFAGGVGAYVAMQPGPKPQPPIDMGDLGQHGMSNGSQEQTQETNPETSAVKAPPKIAIPVLQAQILSTGVDAARQRSDNRSKEFCRVLNSSAYAVRGLIQEAEGQLAAFDGFKSGLDFMKISPLCQIAWHHLGQGDKATALKVADQAAANTAKLPSTGPDAVQQAVALGTLQIALGRQAEARQLVESRESLQQDDIAQSAARISIVVQDQTFDLAKSYEWLPRIELASPLSFAVTYGAVVHGYEQEAYQWIEQLSSPERKADSLAAYAAGLAFNSVRSGKPFSPETILASSGVDEFAQARALALAMQVLQQRQPASVAALQQQIVAKADVWEVPADISLPEFREIYDGKYVAAPASRQSAVHVYLLLARQAVLAGQTEQAWKHAEAALKWSQTTAPALKNIKPIFDRVDQDRTRIEEQLGSLLGLQRADQKRSAFNQYRKNLRDIEEQAQKRYNQEVAFLERMLDWKLASPLAAYYQQQLTSASKESNLVEIVEQKLFPDLMYSLKEVGDEQGQLRLAEKKNALSGTASQRQIVDQILQEARAGNVSRLLSLYASLSGSSKRPLLFLQVACELARNQSPDVIVEWVNTIPDPVVQELAFRLTAAQLTQRGLVRELWEASQRRNLSATDKCSLNLGIMEGLDSTKVYDEALPVEKPAP